MTDKAKKLLMLYEQSGKRKTMESAPPLTFKGYGKNLKNYRIYGNTVNGESVGDFVETGEHAGEYRVPVTVSNGTDTQTTNLYLPEQIKMVGDEAEYVDYKEQKQHRVRKNLLPNTAKSQTINGVTFTVNGDGSVTCNGTVNGGTAVFWMPAITLPAGQCSINGCPVGGSESTTYKILIVANNKWLTNDVGSGANFTLTETSTVSVRMAIYNGYTCNNLTFYPMIRKADIEDDTYEPYIENTEVDVTLPAIPTLDGTNTLSIGTTVQPSNVYVKSRHESSYEAAMRERYEEAQAQLDALESGGE